MSWPPNIKDDRCPHRGERDYYAKGQCYRCYNAKWTREARRLARGVELDEVLPRGRMPRGFVAASCHPHRNAYAKGLCKSCYGVRVRRAKRERDRTD